MKKLLATALAATALLGSVFALGEKKSKQTVITVLDYQDATAPNSFDDNKLIWEAFEAAHPDIKIEREALFNEAFHQKAAAYAAAGKMPDVFYMWPAGRSTSIHEKKLAKDSWEEKENSKGETYKEKGFVYAVSDVTTGSISFDPEADYWYSDDRILEENKEYLDKCVELCKENGVEFELVTAPCSVTYMYFVGGYDDADKWYRNYAKEKGINYINLNYLKGREDFLPDELMYDNCHTNGEGAYVTSEKYADLLLKEEKGEDISSYFYENLDEFKKDVHRIVALEAELEYSETANDDGSVDATMHLLSLKNPDAKAFYQIELQADGSDETTVLSEFSEKETVSIKLLGYTGYKLIVRAKSQYEGDKEAKMVYSY